MTASDIIATAVRTAGEKIRKPLAVGEEIEGICSLCGKETVVRRLEKDIGSDGFVAYHTLHGSRLRGKGYVCQNCQESYEFLKNLGTNNHAKLAVFDKSGVFIPQKWGEGWRQVILNPPEPPYVILFASKLHNYTGVAVVGADRDWLVVNPNADFPGQFVIVNRLVWKEHLEKGSSAKEVRQDSRLSPAEKDLLLLAGVLLGSGDEEESKEKKSKPAKGKTRRKKKREK